MIDKVLLAPQSAYQFSGGRDNGISYSILFLLYTIRRLKGYLLIFLRVLYCTCCNKNRTLKKNILCSFKLVALFKHGWCLKLEACVNETDLFIYCVTLGWFGYVSGDVYKYVILLPTDGKRTNLQQHSIQTSA